MATRNPPKHGVTPPKGRPTRSRRYHRGDRRVFGATARWIAAFVLLVIAFVVLVLVTDGGDFNPLNGSSAPTVGPTATPTLGVGST